MNILTQLMYDCTLIIIYHDIPSIHQVNIQILIQQPLALHLSTTYGVAGFSLSTILLFNAECQVNSRKLKDFEIELKTVF